MEIAFWCYVIWLLIDCYKYCTIVDV